MLSHEQARKFYDRFGSGQDRQGFYEDAAVADLIAHAGLPRAGSVIEFGCGTGRFAEILLARHLPSDARYLGLDISATMTALATERLAKFDARARVLQTDGTMRLNAPSASFDRFFSAYVLDLLAEDDIRSLIDEAYRVLAPGGLLGLISLTHGFTAPSRFIARVWTAIHRVRPMLVGGCRPLSLESFVKGSWDIRHVHRVTGFGVPSEVLLAEKARADGA